MGKDVAVRRASCVALAALLLLALAARAAPAAQAQTPPADVDLPGGIGHFYTQANGGAGPQYGYRITDEGGIAFWSEFQRLGGAAVLGYPSSRRFTLDGFTVQATQKVLLQWRPEVHRVYFVNVFDVLHDKGLDPVLQATYQIPPQLAPAFDAGKPTFDAISRARLALLNDDLPIAARYYDGRRQPQAVLYNGLPTSRVTKAGPFSVVRAQRIAIQHWAVANPAAGIAPGDVTVVNGGDIAKQLGLVPAPAASTETIVGVVNAPAPATPAATPAPTPRPQPAAALLSKQVTALPTDCGIPADVPCRAAGGFRVNVVLTS